MLDVLLYVHQSDHLKILLLCQRGLSVLKTRSLVKRGVSFCQYTILYNELFKQMNKVIENIFQ